MKDHTRGFLGSLPTGPVPSGACEDGDGKGEPRDTFMADAYFALRTITVDNLEERRCLDLVDALERYVEHHALQRGRNGWWPFALVSTVVPGGGTLDLLEHRLQVVAFLRHALNRRQVVGELQSQDNWGVVSPQDGTWRCKLLTQFMVHRRHVLLFGYLFPPDIRDWFSDNWITHLYRRHQLDRCHPAFRMLNNKEPVVLDGGDAAKGARVLRMGSPRYRPCRNREIWQRELERSDGILREARTPRAQ